MLMRMRRTEGDARVGVGEEGRVGRRVGDVSTRSRGNVSLIRRSRNGEIVRCCSFPSSSTLTLICELWIHRIRLSAPCEVQRDNLSKSVNSPKFESVNSPLAQLLSSSTLTEYERNTHLLRIEMCHRRQGLDFCSSQSCLCFERFVKDSNYLLCEVSGCFG